MMWSETAPYLETLRTSVLLIVIASFGGLVLFGLKISVRGQSNYEQALN